MNLGKLPDAEKILETSLGRARKEAAKISVREHGIKLEKSREIRRIEVAADYAHKTLVGAVKSVPNIEQMHPFYKELIRTIIDTDELRKALAQIDAVAGIIVKLKRIHIVKVKRIGKRSNVSMPREMSRQLFGRLASALKSLGKSIEVYNNAAEKLRELPNIKEDIPTAIIAGYPNAGKSTLLAKITKSKPRIAAYPFTTQRLELGYFSWRYHELQVIDTPGLLDRELEKRNAIERKGIAALRHLASLIVFVLDPTESVGLQLEKQLTLLSDVGKEFGTEKIIIYLSKTDIASAEQMDAAVAGLKGFAIFTDAEGVKEAVAERLVKKRA